MLRTSYRASTAKHLSIPFTCPPKPWHTGGEEKGSRAKIEKREKCFASRRRQADGAAGRVNSVPSVALRALTGKQSRFALRSVIAGILRK